MTARRSFLKFLAATALLPACSDPESDSGGSAGSNNCPAANGGTGPGGGSGASGGASAGMSSGGAGPTGDQLIFLGTQGGPRFGLLRGETATALIVGNQPYLIDCGYGAFRALIQAGIDPLKIAQFFLTHLHDDHVSDLAALLGHQWAQGRKDPTTVYGPYATDALVAATLAFNAADIRIRTADEGRTLAPDGLFTGVVIDATDTPNKVYQDANIAVTSIQNTHFSDTLKMTIPDRSLAYRVDSAARSVVFSGDTTYTDNIVALAQGADILVCEAMDVVATRASFDAQVAAGAYGDNPEGVWNHIVGTHTPCADAGRMAAAANVKTLVINHLVPGGLNAAETDSNYIDQITPYFTGKVVVSADQMIL
jgi:ribonuclease BN (tRNA processing enzyme)